MENLVAQKISFFQTAYHRYLPSETQEQFIYYAHEHDNFSSIFVHFYIKACRMEVNTLYRIILILREQKEL